MGVYEQNYLKTIDRLENNLVAKKEGTEEIDVEKTQKSRKEFLETLEKHFEDVELDVEIAKCRLEAFQENSAVLPHKATFQFEKDNPRWIELQTKKLIRSFKKDIETAEKDLLVYKAQIDATKFVIKNEESKEKGGKKNGGKTKRSSKSKD